jgi:hypothetical protein
MTDRRNPGHDDRHKVQPSAGGGTGPEAGEGGRASRRDGK